MHVIAQVLKGLAKAHAAGIVHRDLKPDNVFLLKSDTDPLFAKIVDFGVSKIERPRDKTTPLALTGRGTVLGTPFYMCPEQAQAMPDVDVRADIYSVGAILFECLTGRPPHTGETYEQIILSICMSDAPDVRAIDPNIPAGVAAFLTRALSRERTDRFPTAERMLAALHELAPEEKVRVPLEQGPLQTIVSAQQPSSGRGGGLGETRIAGSGSDPGLPPPVSQPQSAKPAGGTMLSGGSASVPEPARAAAPDMMSTSAALSAAGIPTARKRSLGTVIATALLAMFLGIAVVVGAVLVLDKKSGAASAAPPPPRPTVTSAASSSAPAPPSIPSAEPAPAASAPSEAPKPSTSARPRVNAPKPAGGAGGTKPLDISRDLP